MSSCGQRSLEYRRAATTSEELDLNLIFNVMMVMITDLISNIHSHMDKAYHGFITIKEIITAQTTPPRSNSIQSGNHSNCPGYTQQLSSSHNNNNNSNDMHFGESPYIVWSSSSLSLVAQPEKWRRSIVGIEGKEMVLPSTNVCVCVNRFDIIS